MIRELTSAQKKGLSVIKKKDKIIHMFTGELSTGIIISSKDVDYINFYLKKFVQKVERIYKHVLNNHGGDINIFAPIENIVKEIFF